MHPQGNTDDLYSKKDATIGGMRFGITLPFDGVARARDAGFDFLETSLLAQTGPTPSVATIPILAADSLIPPTLRVVGPDADPAALRAHVHRTTERAAELGIKVIVLDSPAAMAVPEGYDRKQAKSQTLDFLRTALPFFARYDLMLVAGPYRADTCNVLNSLPEVLQYVWAVDHPHFQCLLDAEHFHEAGAPLEHVQDALPWVRHVQLTPDPRNAAILGALKQYKYDGAITLRSAADAPVEQLRRKLDLVRAQWAAA